MSFWFLFLMEDSAIHVPKKFLHFLPVYRRVNASNDYDGRGVSIAFIDSGFFPHPDLTTRRNRIRTIVDVTPQRWTMPQFQQVHESSWHGTMVACAACGAGRWTRRTYRGVAPGADMVLIKVFDGKKIRHRNIIRALEWVTRYHQEYHIRVVNISVGGEPNVSVSAGRPCELIQELAEQGVTVVVAAGNDPARSLASPANCPFAITVGGFNDNNSIDPRRYSEYGTTHGRSPDGEIKPDVIAPAYLLPVPMLPANPLFEESSLLFELQALSDRTLVSRLRKRWPAINLPRSLARRTAVEIRRAMHQRMVAQKYFAPGHQHVDGTSFAAPLASAIIAQMLQANPELTPALIKMILQQTAKPIPHIPKAKQGFGVLDGSACVHRALQERSLKPAEGSPRVLDDRIVFFLNRHDAKQIALVGDFTAWQTDVVRMRRLNEHLWRADLPRLSGGDYRYKFLIDESLWIADPENTRTESDRYGGVNSVFSVGSISNES